MKRICLLVLVLLSTATAKLSANCAPNPSEKEKKESKHYTVDASDKLFIENKYGDVRVNTWDKNEISIDITIKVKCKSETKAQGLIDDIKIEESDKRKSSNSITLKTVIDRNNILLNNNEQIDIDYVINMPGKIGLDLINKFGAVSMEDFQGDLNLNVEYGGLKIRELKGSEKKIKVRFGSLDITSIETGKLDISYSNVKINSAQKLDIKNSFGKTDIKTVNVLNTDQRYGNIHIGSVEELVGNVEFADIDVDNTSKSIDMTLKYSSKADFGIIGPGVDMLKVNGNFSNMYFKLENGLDLYAEIDVSFGEFTNRSSSDNINLQKEVSGKYSHMEHYRGKIGKGTGKMTLKASYGDIIFK